MHLDAVDRDVLHARARVPRDGQTGRDIGTVVVLAVGWDGQQFVQVHLVQVDDLLACGLALGHLAHRQRLRGGAAQALEQAGLGHAHRLGDPRAARHEPAHDRNGMAARPAEERRALAIEPLGDGCEGVL